VPVGGSSRVASTRRLITRPEPALWGRLPSNDSNGGVEDTIELEDGRTVAFATFGSPDGIPVIWCHGGPGSRLDPIHRDAEAARAGLLLVGVDRPGYGLSTPLPGRTIADWVPDAVAVANELELDQFVAIGESTGGAYALALAALVPDRALGVVACCSLTDMRYEAARTTMSRPHCHAVWDASDRQSAIAAAVEAHGVGGSKMTGDGLREALAPSDVVLFQNPVWAEQAMAVFPAMFEQGLVGYTDDRLADGGGWDSFDVTAITCPVTVLHGEMDRMCDVLNARHTAELVPNSRLVLYEDLGHFSIEAKLLPAISELLEH
jgi:pimeloyl-ACP methyl ester carboxylesterase